MPNPYTPGQQNPYTQRPVPIAEASQPSNAKLNARLAELKAIRAKGGVVPEKDLDAKLLRRINVMRIKDGVDLSLLRISGPLPWPSTLQASAYAAGRKQVETLLPEAAKQLKKGEFKEQTISDLTRAVNGLGEKLNQEINEMPPTEFLEARRFLRGLKETAEVLRKPNVRELYAENEDLAKECNTVASLLRYLEKKELQFALPSPGDEAAYRELERALAP